MDDFQPWPLSPPCDLEGHRGNPGRDGLRVTIHRSKTDQEGRGDVIAVPRGTIACPVAALKAWLEAAAIAEGPVFRPIASRARRAVFEDG